MVQGWAVVTLENGPTGLQFLTVRRDGTTDRAVRWRVGPPGSMPRTQLELGILAREKAKAAESPLQAILRRYAGD